MKIKIKNEDINEIFGLVFLVLITSVFIVFAQSDEGSLWFVTEKGEPLRVPHNSEVGNVIDFNNIGNIYFGSDTNYIERGIRSYINEEFYGEDAKVNDYRLIVYNDPVLCHTVVESASGVQKARKENENGDVTFNIEIFKDGETVKEDSGVCLYKSYLGDNENKKECAYKFKPAELFNSLEEASDNLRGSRFTCKMTITNGEDTIESTSKEVVVADVNYHVTSIVPNIVAKLADRDENYGNINEQYDYFTELSGVRPQIELDNKESKEKLGKLVFHKGIAMNVASEVIEFLEVQSCTLNPEHPKRVMELLNFELTDDDKEYGDALISISDSLFTSIQHCDGRISARFSNTQYDPESIKYSDNGFAIFGKNYVLLTENVKAFSFQADSVDGKIKFEKKPSGLAHELGHAMKFGDGEGKYNGYGACDEYRFSKWKVQDEQFKSEGFSGCPNSWPSCCCTKDMVEKGEGNCKEVNRACMADFYANKEKPGIGDLNFLQSKPVCAGMPKGFSENNKFGPFTEFSIMGKGTWYPDYFPEPLPKKE